MHGGESDDSLRHCSVDTQETIPMLQHIDSCQDFPMEHGNVTALYL